MKKLNPAAFLIAVYLLISACQPTPGRPLADVASVTLNTDTLLRYHNKHLRLNYLFDGFDENGKPMADTDFLSKVETGNYLPMHLATHDDTWQYRLVKLDAGANDDVKSILKTIGKVAYGIHWQTGRPLPKFRYTDLNGNVYTSENTKGKIMVLKAWFTGCEPCVDEMPILNKLVAKYKNRKDIIFVSLAGNSPASLHEFLKRTRFDYAIVPKGMYYMQDTLHIEGYPAHWVINKQGIVVNKSYLHDDMIAALAKEAAK